MDSFGVLYKMDIIGIICQFCLLMTNYISLAFYYYYFLHIIGTFSSLCLWPWVYCSICNYLFFFFFFNKSFTLIMVHNMILISNTESKFSWCTVSSVPKFICNLAHHQLTLSVLGSWLTVLSLNGDDSSVLCKFPKRRAFAASSIRNNWVVTEGTETESPLAVFWLAKYSILTSLFSIPLLSVVTGADGPSCELFSGMMSTLLSSDMTVKHLAIAKWTLVYCLLTL